MRDRSLHYGLIAWLEKFYPFHFERRMFYLPLKEADKVKFVRPIELASAQNNVQIPNKLQFPFFISVLLCGLFRRGILCMKIYDYLFVIFILHLFAQKRVLV